MYLSGVTFLFCLIFFLGVCRIVTLFMPLVKCNADAAECRHEEVKWSSRGIDKVVEVLLVGKVGI